MNSRHSSDSSSNTTQERDEGMLQTPLKPNLRYKTACSSLLYTLLYIAEAKVHSGRPMVQTVRPEPRTSLK